jgi:hypothetical protein
MPQQYGRAYMSIPECEQSFEDSNGNAFEDSNGNSFEDSNGISFEDLALRQFKLDAGQFNCTPTCATNNDPVFGTLYSQARQGEKSRIYAVVALLFLAFMFVYKTACVGPAKKALPCTQLIKDCCNLGACCEVMMSECCQIYELVTCKKIRDFCSTCCVECAKNLDQPTKQETFDAAVCDMVRAIMWYVVRMLTYTCGCQGCHPKEGQGRLEQFLRGFLLLSGIFLFGALL